jgi:hypothetical protein
MKTLSSKNGMEAVSRLARPDITWIAQYRVLLARGLNEVERFLSPSCKDPGALLSKFDAESFEKCLVFAVTYPVLSTVYNYFRFDIGSYLGSVLFFPGTTILLKRLFVLTVFLGSPIISAKTIYDYNHSGIVPERNLLVPINTVFVFCGSMVILFPYDNPYNLVQALMGSLCVSTLYSSAFLYIVLGRCGGLLVISAISAIVFGFGVYALWIAPLILALHILHLQLKATGRLYVSMILMPNVSLAHT